MSFQSQTKKEEVITSEEDMKDEKTSENNDLDDSSKWMGKSCLPLVVILPSYTISSEISKDASTIDEAKISPALIEKSNINDEQNNFTKLNEHPISVQKYI